MLAALSAKAGIDPGQVEAVRAARLEARGGFEELVYLESTSPDVVSGLAEREEARRLFDTADFYPELGEASPIQVSQPSARSITFRVPLVPPLLDGLPLREHRLEVGGTVVTFRHSGRDIEVSVELVGPEIGPGQLSLAIE